MPLVQQQQFGSIREESGSTITIQQIVQISPDVVKTSAFNPTSPYLGLSRFEEKHRSLFFGREPQIATLFLSVINSSLTFVAGASGCGKSSLVRAGLIPHLYEKQPKDSFFAFTLTPFRNPFESLRIALIAGGCSPDLRIPESLTDRTLLDVVQTNRQASDSWLLFIDQFEEVFTLCSDLRVREVFLKGLVELCRAASPNIRVVVAMRADFFDRFGPYPEVADLATQNLHLITDMLPSQLRVAIEQPASLHGVVFEDQLVDRIIDEVRAQPGALPLLQYTLDLLWREDDPSVDRTLNIDSYRALGGIEGALKRRADALYEYKHPQSKTLRPQAEREAFRRLFLRLVDLTGHGAEARAVSKRALRKEFVAPVEAQLIDELSAEKLLICTNTALVTSTPSPDGESAPSSATKPDARTAGTSKGSGDASPARDGAALILRSEPTVELAHEALLSAWPTLRDWIAQGAEVIFVRNRLAEGAQHWQKARTPDSFGRVDAQRAEEELWIGSRLEQAQEMVRRSDFDSVVGGLSAQEQAFLSASLEHRRQRDQAEALRKKQRSHLLVSFASILSLFLIVAVVAAVIAQKERRDAQRNERMAVSRQLSANATTEFEHDHERATLLGIAAMRSATTVEAIEFLFLALTDVRPTESLGIRSIQKPAGIPDKKPKDEEKDPITRDPPDAWAPVYSHAGDKLALQRANGTVLVIDRKSGQATIYPLPQSPSAESLGPSLEDGVLTIGLPVMQFTADDGELVVGSLSAGVQRIDLRTAQVRTVVPPVWSNPEQVEEFLKKQAQLIDANSTIAEIENPIAIVFMLLAPRLRSMRALSGDAGYFAAVCLDGSIGVWETRTGKRLPLSPPAASASTSEATSESASASACCVAFSHDGQSLAAAPIDGGLRIWTLPGGAAEQLPLAQRPSMILKLAFSPKGRTLLVSRSTGPIEWVVRDAKPELWPSKDTTPELAPRNATSEPRSPVIDDEAMAAERQENMWRSARLAAFSEDGSTMAVAVSEEKVALFDLRTKQWKRGTLAAGKGKLLQLELSRSGGLLAATTEGGLQLWNTVNGHQLGPVIAEIPDLGNITIHPIEDEVIVAGFGKLLRVPLAWYSEIGGTLSRADSPMHSVSFAPDGQTLAVASHAGSIELWDTKQRKPLSPPLRGHSGKVFAVAFAPDGKTLASGGQDGSLLLWDVATQRLRTTPLHSHGGAIYQVAISPDASDARAATAGFDHSVRLWDLRHPARPPMVLWGHSQPVFALAYSPDGRRLASGGMDGLIRVWDGKSGKALCLIEHLPACPQWKKGLEMPSAIRARMENQKCLPNGDSEGHTDVVSGLAFSPDGKLLVSASWDGTLRIWHPESCASRGQFLVPTSQPVYGVAFNRQGNQLAAGSGSVLAVWDVETRRMINLRLDRHGDLVTGLSFGNSSLLASASSDGTVRLWNLDQQWWAQELCARSKRSLSQEEWGKFIFTEPFPGPGRGICQNQ